MAKQMNSRRTQALGNFLRRLTDLRTIRVCATAAVLPIVLLISLLTSGIFSRALGAGPQAPSATQGPREKEPTVDWEQDWEDQVRKENIAVIIAMTILQRYLPPGARVTSGYRDAEDQLKLIGRMAQRNGIQVQKMNVNDPETWMPVLSALRQQKFIVAAPDRTPHTNGKFVVFDLSGADLNAIKEGILNAKNEGMVVLQRAPLIEPRNNAVHVELNLTPKALYRSGLSQQVPRELIFDASGPDGTPPSLPQDEKTAALLRLQNLHDANPNPVKKIDYDRQKKFVCDPLADHKFLKELDDEIERHEREAEQLAQNKQKDEATRKIDGAIQEGRFEDAERVYRQYEEAFSEDPGAKGMLNEIKTERLTNEAIDALVLGCGECEKARQIIDAALQVSPKHQAALRIKQETESCLKNCKTQSLAKVTIIVLAAAGLIVGLYFLLRPKRWVLEGVQGPCRGDVFPLDKEEIRIGALGPPEGEADIVISDRAHKISRLHCLIVQSGRHLYLSDESSNGTKINDQEIEKERYIKLRNGDEITLGDEAVLLLRPA